MSFFFKKSGSGNQAKPITASQIAVGTDFALALTHQGSAVGWGNFSSVPTEALSNVTQIAISPTQNSQRKQSTVLLSNGTVFTWGTNSNYSGQPSSAINTNVKQVKIYSEGVPTAYSATNYTVLLKADGSVKFWNTDFGGSPGNVAAGYGEVIPVKRQETIRSWRGIAISDTGNIQTAVVYGGNIYTTVNGGETWIARDSAKNWTGVAMSGNGVQQTAITYPGGVSGNIYTSSNSGETWTSRHTSSQWIQVAMSSDGLRQTAVRAGGLIANSSNYGVSWTDRSVSKFWTDVKMSSNGQYQIATNYDGVVNQGVYTSSDYGVTWTPRTIADNTYHDYRACAVSSNGAIMIVVDKWGYVYKSTNYGVNWGTAAIYNISFFTYLGYNDYTACQMDSTGSQIYIANSYEDEIFYSSDGGTTWKRKQFVGASGSCRAIGSNSNMSKIYFIPYNYDNPTVLLQSMEFDLSTDIKAIETGFGVGYALKSNGSIISWGSKFVPATTPKVYPNFIGITPSLTAVNFGITNSSATILLTENYLDSSLLRNTPAALSQATHMIPASATWWPAPMKSVGVGHVTYNRYGSSFAINYQGDLYGQLSSPYPVLDTIGGGAFNIGITKFGTVAGWGRSDSGQTSVPHNYDSFRIYSTSISNGNKTIAAGNKFSQAMTIQSNAFYNPILRNSTQIIGWGDNTNNKLSQPSSFYWSGYFPTSIVSGFDHTMVLNWNGSLYLYGSDAFGQLQQPVGVMTSFFGSKAKYIAAGNYHNLVIAEDGTFMTSGRAISNTPITVWARRSTPFSSINTAAYSFKMSDTGSVQLVSGKSKFTGYSNTRTHSKVAYVSTDFGINWISRLTSTYDQKDAAMSSTGQYQLISSSSNFDSLGTLHRSTDSGTTWTTTGIGTKQWSGVAMSSNGQYQIATSEWMSTGEQAPFIYFSSNYGAAWTGVANPPTELGSTWSRVGMSGNGQYITVCPPYWRSGFLYRSINTGGAWSLNTSFTVNGVAGIDISNDGSKQVIGESLSYQNQWGSGRLLLSNDFGATWTMVLSGFNFTGVTMTPDGTKIICSVDQVGKSNTVVGCFLLVSEDGGLNFYRSYVNDESQSGTVAVDINSDGSIQGTIVDDVGPGLLYSGNLFKKAIRAAGGENHSLVLRSDGSVIAWGNNNTFGQTTVPALAQSGVIDVAAGSNHSVALKANGSVVVWGDTANGKTTVPALAQSGIKAISAKANSTLALRVDGSVIGWGGATPPIIPALAQSGVIDIVAGVDHWLALKNDGTVVGWGNDSNNQIKVPQTSTLTTLVSNFPFSNGY